MVTIVLSPTEQRLPPFVETSKPFCGHVSFPEINGGMSVCLGTKSNNHKEGG